MKMTGKQRGFEMTKRNNFERKANCLLYAVPELIDRDIFFSLAWLTHAPVATTAD